MSNPTSEPRTEHQDDPWKELLEEWCGQPWKPVATSGANVHWCPHCGASRYTHDVGVARAAVDARHAEEIAAKDRENEQLRAEIKRLTQEPFRLTQDLTEARSQTRKAEAELATLREQLAAVQQERDEKAAMHSELATLAGSAIVLATLDTLAGERPTQEPEHALPAAVWRLVQERDEARAANTANLREMVGMAGRFRQTLQTVRACIVALTPGHRTGYDWNADPLYLTRKEGEALSAIDAALSSPSTQEPQPHAFQPVGTVGQARYTCVTCGEDEGFATHTPEPPTQHWAVDVRRNGENLVTIESNCLSGKPEFSEVEADVIRQCADHLHAFIGPPSTQEPQTVCAWREDRGNRYAACLTASGVVVPHTPIPTMDQWRACPYCTLPLTLSPESPNEGAK